MIETAPTTEEHTYRLLVASTEWSRSFMSAAIAADTARVFVRREREERCERFEDRERRERFEDRC
jgi:hypothetical protein